MQFTQSVSREPVQKAQVASQTKHNRSSELAMDETKEMGGKGKKNEKSIPKQMCEALHTIPVGAVATHE